MSSIYGLLNIKEEALRDFSLQSLSIQRNQGIDRILNNAVRELKEIVQKVSSYPARPEFSNETIEEIIEKVKKDASKGGGASWNLRELRILSFYLMRLQKSEDQFMFALNLLKKNWINIFINGIVFFILNSWTTCSEFIRHQCVELLKEKMSNYDGIIDKYVRLKKHLDFFDDAGPMRMAALIAHNGIEIYKAPEIIGYNKSNLSLTYFSEVILFYIKKRNLSADEIEEIFNHHSLIRTKKLAMANLIEKAEKDGNAIEQSNVSRCARRVLGYDITLETTWAAFTGATAEETRLLKHAHELVTSWYARKSVETFFEVACQDKERREFWLNFVTCIKDFRIVGSQSVRSILQSDGRLSDTLRSCFIETRSKMSQTAALVLYIGQKVFVEFSDKGALYIYNTTHEAINNLKQAKDLADTKELKTPSLQKMWGQEEYGAYGKILHILLAECKLFHSGDWQSRLIRWLKEMVFNDSFISNKYSLKENNLPILSSTAEFKSYKPHYCKEIRFTETDELRTFIESSPIADNRIKIIVSTYGYYIKTLSHNIYYLFNTPIACKEGAIHIKEPDYYGIREVDHYFDKNKIRIGYIKFLDYGLLFAKNYTDQFSFISL